MSFAKRVKRLRLESLESRTLLSVSPSSVGLDAKTAMVASAAWPAPAVAAAQTNTEVIWDVKGVTASSDDGNVPQNTLDGKLDTRWSAKGDGQYITYDLGQQQTVSGVKIAFQDGTTRVAKFDVLTSTDGSHWTKVYSGQSSGTTNELQSFSFADTAARYVRIVGHKNTVNAWNSFTEVAIFDDTGTAPPTNPPANTTALIVTGVTATSDDGNVPQNTLDGKLDTRWSANGDGQSITYDLGGSQKVSSVDIAFHQGTSRVSKFDILTSTDGVNWTKVFSGQSSGKTNAPERFSFAETTARYVRIVGHMNTSNTWNSLTEVAIRGTQVSTPTNPPPTDPPPTDPPPTTDPGQFDLSHWKLTLPTGSSGHPTEISAPQLVAGYSSQYFYRGKDGELVFWCPVTGVTTSGSSYSRSELRETNPDGSLYNWNVADGTATLAASLAVNTVPSTGKVVVGQIHDNGAGGIKGQPLLKLVYKYDSASGTGILEAQVRPYPESSTSDNYTVATGIKLNEVFSYKIELKADLTLNVQINGQTKYSKSIDSRWKSQGMYFKAGSYCQDNSGSSTEGAKVSFYDLTVAHS